MSKSCTLTTLDRCRQCRKFQKLAETPLATASNLGNQISETLARTFYQTAVEQGFAVAEEGSPGYAQDFVACMQLAQHFFFNTMRSLANEEEAAVDAEGATVQ